MSELDTGGTLPDRRVSFLYGTLVAAVALSALAGCSNLGPAERQSLIQTSDMYGRGQSAAAAARLDRLISEFGQAVEIGEAYYLRGLCRIRGGEVTAASEDFKEALDKSRRPDLTARCQASMAAIAYRRGDWAEAAKLYDESLAELPDQPPKDEILYYAGMALRRSGKWKEAMEKFSWVLSRFRHRPIAVDARRKAGWRHEWFAIQLEAFEDVNNAAKAERSFRERGLQAVRENLPRGDRAMWVVMVGQHSTYDKALAALPGVRRIQPNAFIIP